ncbi:MAG: hypothetical protein J0G30_13760 [Actinomycetales bacterium]|nr:hypothetical protein [Actinomycetales bacterium]
MSAASPRRSLFRAALARSEGPALGTWIKLPAIESVELAALAGFDFAVIDLEHSPLSIETASQQIAVALLAGIAPIVRVPALDAGVAQRLLDAGAEGLMLPHVDTVEQAEAAAALTRFPPRGLRGVGSTSRAGGWGAVSREEYLRFGREEVVIIAQLESEEAVHAAAAIGAVDGVDALLLGAADLSTSLGTTEADPRVAELTARAVAGARTAGVPIGNAGGATTAAVQSAVDAGFTFTLMSNDATLLGSAASAALQAGRGVRFP